jgi:hypothetical protein
MKKMMRNLGILFVVILFSAPLVYGQELSKYRNFSFGMTLADLSKLVDQSSTDVNVLHQRPALIQELTWWPPQPSGSAPLPESVRELRFSFYNSILYRIVLTYDTNATEGLTGEDLVQAISAKYGPALRPVAEIKFSGNENYGTTEKVIARWEDPQYSFTLFHSTLSHTFGLVMISKQVNAQADAAALEAVKLERQEAPGKEVARVKNEATALEDARLKNKKSFRP